MRTDFDRCFESVLIGNRQAVLLHKYLVDPDRGIWHVCTVDCNGHYSSYHVRLDRTAWTLSLVSRDTAVAHL